MGCKEKTSYYPHLDKPISIPLSHRNSLVRRLAEAQEKSGLGGNKRNISTRK
jgi:hypothetical protein